MQAFGADKLAAINRMAEGGLARKEGEDASYLPYKIGDIRRPRRRVLGEEEELTPQGKYYSFYRTKRFGRKFGGVDLDMQKVLMELAKIGKIKIVDRGLIAKQYAKGGKISDVKNAGQDLTPYYDMGPEPDDPKRTNDLYQASIKRVGIRDCKGKKLDYNTIRKDSATLLGPNRSCGRTAKTMALVLLDFLNPAPPTLNPGTQGLGPDT